MLTSQDEIGAIAAVAIQVAGDSLSYGIMWYEKNAPEVQRTLINRLISNNCGISILFNTCTLNFIIAMIFFRGLGPDVCDVFMFCLVLAVYWYLMNVNLATIVRYIYICHFQNVGALYDDLLYTFLTVVSFLLSLYFVTLLWFFKFLRNPPWFKCTYCASFGDALVTYDRNMWVLLHPMVGTLGLHLLLKVLMCKKKTTTQEDLDISTKKSIVNLGVYTGALAFILVSTLMFTNAIRKIFGPHNNCGLYPVLWATFINSIFNQATYYVQNKDMRKKVFGKLLSK